MKSWPELKSSMSSNDLWIRLRHMRDYTAEAIRLGQTRSRADLDNDRLLNLALVRLCEMIGEAANRVPLETRKRHPQIAWPQIVGFRNRLIHGYDSIDLDILWQVVIHDLPHLFVAIEAILSSESE
jgi:uncharacterized protein with HEPN domain